MHPTPPRGVDLVADQAAYDALQDARVRALRPVVLAAGAVACVALGAVAALSLHRPSPSPSPVVHVAAPPACPPVPACPACAACAACPACPSPPARGRHAR